MGYGMYGRKKSSMKTEHEKIEIKLTTAELQRRDKEDEESGALERNPRSEGERKKMREKRRKKK